ncbi:sugar transferase, partial [Aeromonas enteropelogenes]
MKHPIPKATLVIKRTMDLAGASLGLLLTLPLWPFIMLAIRLDSPGPVFFRQLRIGRSHASHTELFFMIKFRTMR